MFRSRIYGIVPTASTNPLAYLNRPALGPLLIVVVSAYALALLLLLYGLPPVPLLLQEFFSLFAGYGSVVSHGVTTSAQHLAGRTSVVMSVANESTAPRMVLDVSLALVLVALGWGIWRALWVRRFVGLTAKAVGQKHSAASAAGQISSDSVFHADLTGAWTFVGDRWQQLTGQSANVALATGWQKRIDSDKRKQTTDLWREKIRALKPFAVEFEARGHDGTLRQLLLQAQPEVDEAGKSAGYVGTIADITQHRFVEAGLEKANLDALTGGPTRFLLIDRLRLCLSNWQDDGAPFAVLYIDIDRFKQINGALGYPAGDRLLVKFVERIASYLPPGTVVARVAGDEFVVILERTGEIAFAVAQANRLVEAVRKPFVDGGQTVFLSASIGIAQCSRSHRHAEEVLRDAHLAVDSAKRFGGRQCAVFDPAMHSRVVETLRIDTSLRHAFDRHQLELWYQPVIDLATGRPIGAEALLRWRHPERGIISPLEFLPVARQSDLIVELESWVLNQACQQLRRWSDVKLIDSDFWTAINVSGRQFRDSVFTDKVSHTLNDYGLDPSTLKLEITESEILENLSKSIDLLNVLQKTGVRFSLDDFGTGYSSIKYLRELPISTLKVDKSFVMDMLTDERSAELVRAIVDMARGYKLEVVAEGIETKEALDHLLGLRCEFGQGYLFAKPMPVGEAAFWLEKARRQPQPLCLAAPDAGGRALVTAATLLD